MNARHLQPTVTIVRRVGKDPWDFLRAGLVVVVTLFILIVLYDALFNSSMNSSAGVPTAPVSGPTMQLSPGRKA